MLRNPALSLLLTALILAACSAGTTEIAGNSTSTGNAQATGTVLRPTGQPARGAWVECRPDSLASWQPLEPTWAVQTDSLGRYRCTQLPEGPVGISALDPASGLSRWRQANRPGPAPDTGTADTLAPPGNLRVALPPSTWGTLHLSGLGRYLPLQGEPVAEFRDLPAGWHGAVRLTTVQAPDRVVDSARIASGATDSAGFTRRSELLVLPLAGGLVTTLRQVPLLVRLDSSWGGFARSLPDGSDLRLSLPDGTALPLTLASWDPQARTGAFWTVLDSLPAPADSVRLMLGSGLPVPAAAPDNGFDATNGFVAAWPLGDTGSRVQDRTGAFLGTPTALASIDGPFGKASRFDGRLSLVLIPGTQTGALALPEGGPYTLSCWARLQDFGTSRYLMGAGNQGFGLKFQKNLGTDTNCWFGIDSRTSGTVSARYALAPADTARWTHLALTVSDSTVALFVDGVRADTGTRSFANGLYRRIQPFALGTVLDSTGASGQHFRGDLAEAWVHSTARSPEWIRLTAANQRPGAPIAKLR